MTHFTTLNHSSSSIINSHIINNNNNNNFKPTDFISSSGGGGGGRDHNYDHHHDHHPQLSLVAGLAEQAGRLAAGLLAEHAASSSARQYHEGPSIVAMSAPRRPTQHQEAYYLFFVGSVGMSLNVLVIAMIFLRRNLRRMTSAFLIHASCINFLKAAFCIPFGLNLLSGADGSKGNQPSGCVSQGAAFIVIVTTSAVNMVAMICTEAYTFGEVNVGGNAHGTTCCILFGVLVVYITSVILHLGPTLIGGDIVYSPDIGSCAFRLGSATGYVANIMWILIITFALVGVGHFLNKFYKEIQLNRPNRVSMLVRHSITIAEDTGRKPSTSTVHEMTQEAMHRAKIFVITAIAFVLCWYPLFLLIVIDMNFMVSPKVYQAFSFIAWTQSTIEPIILICFDRNINLLSRFMYCDRDSYTASQIAYLMSQTRLKQQHQHSSYNHEDDTSFGPEEDLVALGGATEGGGEEEEGATASAALGEGGAGAMGGRGAGLLEREDRPRHSNDLSLELADAFNTNSSSRGDSGTGMLAAALATTPVCRHCSPRVTPRGLSPLRSGSGGGGAVYGIVGERGGGGSTGTSSRSHSQSQSHSATPSTSSPRDAMQSLRHFQPVDAAGRSSDHHGLEMAFTYDPVRLKDIEDDVQC